MHLAMPSSMNTRAMLGKLCVDQQSPNVTTEALFGHAEWQRRVGDGVEVERGAVHLAARLGLLEQLVEELVERRRQIPRERALGAAAGARV